MKVANLFGSKETEQPMTSPLITTSRWNIEDGHTLDGYLKSGGYQAIQKALEISPQEVHEEVKKLHFLEEVELVSQQELNGDSSLKTYGPDILL